METKILSSGDTIEIRGMRVKEQALILDRKGVVDGSALNRIMQAAVLTEGINVEDLLIGDRVALLIDIRIATFGPEFVFKAICPACHRPGYFKEDLSQLPRRYLEPSLPLGEDRLVEFQLPRSGSVVKYRYLRGKDERRARDLRAQNREALIQALLRLRTVEVDGQKIVSPRFWDELEAADAAALWAHMEQNDCGVETEIVLSCADCGHVWEADLPIGSRDFFLPRT